MLKWKYGFVGLSLLAFAIGFSHARSNVFFDLGFPLGAILFILFLVTQLLEKESALYDEQNRAAVLAPPASATAPRPRPISRLKEKTNPAFTTAHSH